MWTVISVLLLLIPAGIAYYLWWGTNKNAPAERRAKFDFGPMEDRQRP